MDEAGLHGFDATAWLGLHGPSGMPAALGDALNTEAVAALAEPAMRARLAREGAKPEILGRAAFTCFVAAEMSKCERAVERAQVRIE